MRRVLLIAAVVALIGVVNICAWKWGENDVLKQAYLFADGGGYCRLDDSGVLETVRHDGSIIVPQSRGGSFCCGFTFMVAMRVARDRGLLSGKSVEDVRRFQKLWYGAEKGHGLRECVDAMIALHIGHEVPQDQAQPGDFVIFHRTNGIGHSAVFLDWLKGRDGSLAGLRYRSSQLDTRGIGDAIEYFVQVDRDHGTINRDRLFVGRLDSGSLWRRLARF